MAAIRSYREARLVRAAKTIEARTPPPLPRSPIDDAELPFADPADVVEVDTLFSVDDISSWASRELSDAEARRSASEANVIRLREAEADPKPDPKPDPKADAKPRSRSIRTPLPGVPQSVGRRRPPSRPRFRYQIARPFSGPAVPMAPAARSTARFTDRSAIRDEESAARQRWVEVVGTTVAVVIVIWLLLSL